MIVSLQSLGRPVRKVLMVATMMVLCMTMLYQYHGQDVTSQNVTSQVLALEYVESVEDWPYGIQFARWDSETQVDWNWLKILDKLLLPGRTLLDQMGLLIFHPNCLGCNIVDIGAHTGDTALVLAVAAKGGTVAAFEMGPPVDMLRANKR